MLIRRVWPQASRAPSLSTACVSRHICTKIKDHHVSRNVLVELPNHRQLSRAYSNYAPKGPPPDYNMYSQPPRSRVSRLKDMAIGSILTFTVYLAFVYSMFLEEEEEEKEREEIEAKEATQYEVFPYYQQLLEKAESSDDGSPESFERIHSILKERAMIFTRKFLTDGPDDHLIEYLGPLPKISNDPELSLSEQRVETKDTLVLMSTPPSADKLSVIDESKPRRMLGSMDKPVSHNLVVTINKFTDEEKNARMYEYWQTHPDAPRFEEIYARSFFMVGQLRDEGILHDGPIKITLLFRNEIFSFVYDENA